LFEAAPVLLHMPPRQTNTDYQERLIPFPAHARPASEPEATLRRRRTTRDPDRASAARRERGTTRRRRRQNTPWLQRNALSVAAVSVLVAVLGLGFGLLQTITRPDPSPAQLALGQPEATAAIVGTSVAVGGVQAGPTTALGPPASDAPRAIQANARVIDPNYTVQAGDTLGRIAVQFGTTVERIQALNNLSDPRALRIGTRLVIPPPL
jgi:nucleoid-associated protein YgaU